MGDVVEELRWEPRIFDPDAIGVAVRDGTNDLKVKLPGAPHEGDIAAAIAHVLEWNVEIPEAVTDHTAPESAPRWR